MQGLCVPYFPESQGEINCQQVLKREKDKTQAGFFCYLPTALVKGLIHKEVENISENAIWDDLFFQLSNHHGKSRVIFTVKNPGDFPWQFSGSDSVLPNTERGEGSIFGRGN